MKPDNDPGFSIPFSVEDLPIQKAMDTAINNIAKSIVEANDNGIHAIVGIRQGRVVEVQDDITCQLAFTLVRSGTEQMIIPVPVLFPYVANVGDAIWYIELTGGRLLGVGCTFRG